MHRIVLLLAAAAATLGGGVRTSGAQSARVVAALPPLAPGLDTARRDAAPRGVALDARVADDLGVRVGDRVVLAARAGAPGDTVIVRALVARTADPSEVARREYRARLHLDHLQRLAGYDNRVDRFAVATRTPDAATRAVRAINDVAFGFRAHRSADVAVETSRTFAVVNRFHRAIGVITVVASAVFLLCLLLLKVEERRRDVAALRLMGISRRTVVASVVLEASVVALLGSGLGLAIGAVASRIINWHYQGVYRTPLTFALVTPGVAAFSVALSLVLGVGAGWLAARRLARTPPLALFGR